VAVVEAFTDKEKLGIGVVEMLGLGRQPATAAELVNEPVLDVSHKVSVNQ
jgi:hypothetical protein